LLNSKHIETAQIFIQGLIQGVGFRPFIFRHAHHHNLNGNVYNQNNGVIVHLQGKKEEIELFTSTLRDKAPVAAKIEQIESTEIQAPLFNEFRIEKSKVVNNSVTRISPDIAVCNDCLADVKHQPHRIAYPFTNCTNCGPRFSIIENIPYDRGLTSMKDFEMCKECHDEYNEILDRRFHAQPVACNNCGPEYTLHIDGKQIKDFSQILNQISEIIDRGGVVSMKGLGGFHLACDAFNEKAVKKLRNIKERDGKPFALMLPDISTLRKYTQISAVEEQLLEHWTRPIALVKSESEFPLEIASNLTTLGIFLPYLPFHHQLFEALNTQTLVMTSGNISDCPIITDNQKAISEFGTKTDAILLHNRAIVNRVDDSVIHVINNQPQIIRRARGYVPNPIAIQLKTEGILATGAELSNVFCIGKGKQALLSQHIGDLKNLETMEFFEETLDRFKKLFEFQASHIVCDMHPEYLSSKFARKQGLPVIETQHHHAHIASVMAEYGIDEPVIGISYDGTGYGTDGKIWGSEIMVADLESFERKYHFDYVPIPGGDNVAKEPWRSALAYLHKTYYKKEFNYGKWSNNINPEQLQLVNIALEKGINTPESCSAGRLFDAVAALINICTHATYHAEAPILLEHSIDKSVRGTYPIELTKSISWNNTIKSIVNDLDNNVLPSEISTKFHNTVIRVTFNAIKKIQAETGINKVILSGGTFQNKYVSENLLSLLLQTGIKAFMPRQVPVNDGGIALGQLAIAAKKLSLCV
jgi:hydrogenase maturation protein HypF